MNSNYFCNIDITNFKPIIMKRIHTNITVIFLFLFSLTAVSQTGISKDELLRGINSFNELGFSDVKSTELQQYNQGFADKVFDVMDSDKSEKDKITSLKYIKDAANKDLNDILGEKNFKKYKKAMQKELKPLVRKSKLVKYII